MSEMYHPPVGSDYDLGSPFRQIFAEEAFSTMNGYSVTMADVTDDGTVRFEIMTPRFDVYQDDNSLVTIRLRNIELCDSNTAREMMQGEKNVNADRTSKSEPVVMLLEYAKHELADEDEDVTEEDLQWVPYVFLAIDSGREDRVAILDAQTGRELTDEEVLYALDRVRALRSNLIAEEFEAAMLENEALEYEVQDKVGAYVGFDPGEWIFGKRCYECESDYAVCEHEENRGSLN